MLGGFYIGLGISVFQEYQNAPMARDVSVKQRDAERKEEENKALTDAGKQVTLEPVLYFKDSEAKGELRLANDSQSQFCVKIRIVRDHDGMLLYQSGAIDPGYYIEAVQLEKNLEQGYYPCTILMQYYRADDDQYIGEMARKAAVIIEK